MNCWNTNIFTQFDKQWALVTSGKIEDFNTMTISWGGLGTLWAKPVATVYVKPIRYTYQYLEKNDYFTVSFYPSEYKKDLGILGSLSGRDVDKVAKTSLHAKKIEQGITFEEAEITLLCKKIYWQDLNVEAMPKEVIQHYYQTEKPHRMYVGEVIDIIKA